MSKVVIAPPDLCAEPQPRCDPATAAAQVCADSGVTADARAAERPADLSPSANQQLPGHTQVPKTAIDRIRHLAILFARQAAAEDDAVERRKGLV